MRIPVRVTRQKDPIRHFVREHFLRRFILLWLIILLHSIAFAIFATAFYYLGLKKLAAINFSFYVVGTSLIITYLSIYDKSFSLKRFLVYLDEIETSFLKRSFDLIVGLMLFMICLPVFLVIFIMTYRSENDIFEHKIRKGQFGRIYRKLRFNTNTRWITVSNLDKIPQLINVLRGDMSIVGPRAGSPFFNQTALNEIRVKPGLTGEIKYRLNEKARKITDQDIENLLVIELRIDQSYAARLSFWGDMKLLIQSIAVFPFSIAV